MTTIIFHLYLIKRNSMYMIQAQNNNTVAHYDSEQYEILQTQNHRINSRIYIRYTSEANKSTYMINYEIYMLDNPK